MSPLPDRRIMLRPLRTRTDLRRNPVGEVIGGITRYGLLDRVMYRVVYALHTWLERRSNRAWERSYRDA